MTAKPKAPMIRKLRAKRKAAGLKRIEEWVPEDKVRQLREYAKELREKKWST